MRVPIDNFKAAILVEQNKPLIIDEIELPSNLEIGQVFVKLHTSGICGSQLGEISGVKGVDPYLPHLMGHEGCATVEAIGPGVKNVQIGDLVVLHWRKGEGIQSEVPKYLWRGEKVNAGWVTTFNTHAIVSENRCTSIDKNTNRDHASLFGCAITTGFGVIENNANMRMGESVVVFGAGGIGLSIIQAASLINSFPIIAVDMFDNRLDLARLMGATHVINSKKNNALKEIKNILLNDQLDVFIDNTGITEIIEMGYEMISKRGRLILVGVPKKESNINIHSLPLHFGKLIQGSHGGESIPHEDIPRYLKMLKNNKYSLDNLITSKFDFFNINEALESMRLGESAGRVMIHFN